MNKFSKYFLDARSIKNHFASIVKKKYQQSAIRFLNLFANLL